jgi:hypothetical protein
MIFKDDPCLYVSNDPPAITWDGVRRATLMRWWYALNRSDSDRLVNRPYNKIITITDVDWERNTA